MSNPILYTFRRCPYAIRARMAIFLSHEVVEIREIVLKDKPLSMLDYSPKGTVPVLVLQSSDGRQEVIEESLEIMHWALGHNDVENYLDAEHYSAMLELITENDGTFKYFLDRYKYADRFPEQTEAYYRSQAEEFLSKLEERLKKGSFLFGERACLADIAIFPFVRQFAHVDLPWFESSRFEELKRWLNRYKSSELFLSIMNKYPAWKEGDQNTFLGEVN